MCLDVWRLGCVITHGDTDAFEYRGALVSARGAESGKDARENVARPEDVETAGERRLRFTRGERPANPPAARVYGLRV